MMESLFAGLGPGALLAAFWVVFLAAVVQSMMGMGFGQVSAPILLLVDPGFVPGAVLLMGMAVAVTGAVRGRRDADFREMGTALVGRIIGAAAAGQLLAIVIDTSAFSLVFAGLVLTAVALSALRWRVRLSPATLVAAGALSGFMGTVTSIGAPPMGIVYQNSPGPKVRATLNGFFAAGTAVSLASLAFYGLLDLHDLALALTLAPAMILGTLASKRLTRLVDRRFRMLVLVMCTVSALAILWRTLA